MNHIIACQASPLHQKDGKNLTPATATSYFLTVLVPQYQEKMSLRTSSELRSTAKAFDLVAQGNTERAVPEVQGLGDEPGTPELAKSPAHRAHSGRKSRSDRPRLARHGHQGANRRAEDEADAGAPPGGRTTKETVEEKRKGRRKEKARERRAKDRRRPGHQQTETSLLLCNRYPDSEEASRLDHIR